MGAMGGGLPSGIVTFVFTDIEQSTRLLRRLGDQYGEVLDRHYALMREAWDAGGGVEVSTAGDSVFVAFEDATSAVSACATAQQLLHNESWPGEPVRVRMGVHSGLASPRAGNYVALAVHQAARVMSAAHGGQVLVSDETLGRLAELPGVETVPVGRYRLRDFDEPVALYELAGSGLATGFPAVRALPADGHNLVRPPTPFVGRQEDVTEVAALTAPTRLVTLTGPGGVGKTRLAAEAGLGLAGAWPDGVWMVDVAPLQDAAQLASAIGDAVGAPKLGGDRWHDIVEHLSSRGALVVLDNCERLVEPCAIAVGEIFKACSRCGVLATSQVPLGVANELVWRVETLALPPTGPVAAADAARSPAVQLFVDRATTARRDFRLDDENAPAVAAICNRLDGLPLALELAAARLGVQSLAQVVEGLDDRFRLLRSRSAAAPERQRTMEALLQWSDGLLADDERACLRRLAIFGGSFSMEAAVAAVALDGSGDLVHELVWSLVEKSLVVTDLAANETRLRLLESVRAFGRRQLDDRGETDATAARLGEWYVDRIGPALRRSRAWIGEVAVELPNLRALMPLLAASSPEIGQHLAVTIGRYADVAPSYREGIDELTRYVRELTEPTRVRISLLACLGDLHLRTGDVLTAKEVIGEAEALRDAVGGAPDWDDVAIERTSGDIACRTGDNTTAVEAAKRVLAGDVSERGRARMSSQLGIAALALNDLDTAWSAFEAELAASQRIGDEFPVASAHGNLAEVALRRGDHAAAAEHQRACLTLGLELGSDLMVAFSEIVAARLVAATGAWETAARLQAHAESVIESTGLVLYEDDRRLSDALLEDALRHLGVGPFSEASAAGAGLDVLAAAALADEVLSGVAVTFGGRQ